MTIICFVPPVADVILLPIPGSEVRLEPLHPEMPGVGRRRSAEERRCAAMMLDKLRRGEDLLPAVCDGDRAIDAVVDKLIEQLA